MYHYLIHTASFATQEEIKNYKSLDAYKYFIDGWVVETAWKFYGDTFLLTGKVKHSYAMSQTPLKPWVAVNRSGVVECGHCTCMAGLAETCSHVAAILYWLETAIRINSETTCTSKPNSWLAPSMPTACTHVPYVTLEDLENIAPKRKQKDGLCQSDSRVVGQTPTEQELNDFYAHLNAASNRRPAILSVIPEYSDKFVQSSDHLPPLLQHLYDSKYITLNYADLLNIDRNITSRSSI